MIEDNEKLYAETVRRLMATKSRVLFGNERAAHAAIIFYEFLINAERRVVFLCRNLSSEVFGRSEVILAMEVALRKKVAVDIVIQDRIESEEIRERMLGWQKEGLPITFVEAQGKLSHIKENIAVMDSTAFRLEPNNGETKAFACMFDPNSAKALENQIYEHLSAVA